MSSCGDAMAPAVRSWGYGYAVEASHRSGQRHMRLASAGEALWTIVAGPGRRTVRAERRRRIDAFRAIGNAGLIRRPQTGMPRHHLVGGVVSAAIEAPPALGIGDEAGDGH